MRDIIDTKRAFVVNSIVSCKNVVTEDVFWLDYRGKIDREIVVCSPIVIEDITYESLIERAIKNFKLNMHWY